MFSRAVLPRRICSTSCRATDRSTRLVVQAKVDLQGGPRVIRGKCYVTRDVSTPMPCLKTITQWHEYSLLNAAILACGNNMH